MKNAFILINAFTNHVGELHRAQRLKQELEALGVKTDIVRNSPAVTSMTGDFCVFLDKDRYAARALEKRMRLFNRSEAIELCDDKMLTHLALDGVVPMPKTIPSLLCYTQNAPPSEELLSSVEKLGYPMVVKECFGSLGREVYLVRDRAELEKLSLELRPKPHLYQEFIEESAGRDLRVIVVGGKAIAAMERISEKDFRSNADLGGRGEPHKLKDNEREISEKIAQHLELDYCGIDLLWSKHGMLLCEVNSNAFFQKMEEVTSIDIAKAYAEHVYREIYGQN